MPTWQLDDLGEEGICQRVWDEAFLRTALENLAKRKPRLVMVDINTNEQMHVGIGGCWAFVEYVVFDPWKARVAIDHATGMEKPASLRFEADGASDTEILAHDLIPVSVAIELVASIFRQGVLPNTVEWKLV